MNCPVCKKPLTIAGGIGRYCATKTCPVLDDDLLWNADGTKKVNEPLESSFFEQTANSGLERFDGTP